MGERGRGAALSNEQVRWRGGASVEGRVSGPGTGQQSGDRPGLWPQLCPSADTRRPQGLCLSTPGIGRE